MCCDNQVPLRIVLNPIYHERTNHIKVECHFIREKIQENLMSTGCERIGEQIVDLLTKVLSGPWVEYL